MGRDQTYWYCGALLQTLHDNRDHPSAPVRMMRRPEASLYKLQCSFDDIKFVLYQDYTDVNC